MFSMLMLMLIRNAYTDADDSTVDFAAVVAFAVSDVFHAGDDDNTAAVADYFDFVFANLVSPLYSPTTW